MNRRDDLNRYIDNKGNLDSTKEVVERICAHQHQKDLHEVWNEDAIVDSVFFQNKQKILEKLHRTIQEKDRLSTKIIVLKKVWKYSQAIAASLFIPLLLLSGWFWYSRSSKNNAWVEICSSPGMRTEFTLPDGSKVWLNNDSKLKYPTLFSSNERNVKLTGEAFFSVTKDKKHPFVVTAKEVNVKVLGTRFDVSAYENDSETQVTLASGSVELLSSKGKRLTLLTPGEIARYDNNKDRLISVEHANVFKNTSWIKGKISFTNSTLKEAMNKVERRYNCKIYIKEDTLKTYPITGTFESEDLPRLLELISMAIPIHYQIKQNDQTGLREVHIQGE